MPLWTPPNLAAAQVRADAGPIAGAVAHTKGLWTEAFASTPEAFGVAFRFRAVAGAATNTAMLVDMGIGAAGSETVLIPDINVGEASFVDGKVFYLPLYIPSGQRLSFRSQAVIGGDTVVVSTHLMTKPPFADYFFTSVTAYGVDAANSRGTLITPGLATVYGAWVQLAAATSKNHRGWFALTGQGGDTTLGFDNLQVQIGIGGAGAETIIVDHFGFRESTAEDMSGPTPPFPLYQPIPSGQRLVARALKSSDTNARDVVVYAFS